MPCTLQAIDVLRKAKVLVAPAKAASAGGVMYHVIVIVMQLILTVCDCSDM